MRGSNKERSWPQWRLVAAKFLFCPLTTIFCVEPLQTFELSSLLFLWPRAGQIIGPLGTFFEDGKSAPGFNLLPHWTTNKGFLSDIVRRIEHPEMKSFHVICNSLNLATPRLRRAMSFMNSSRVLHSAHCILLPPQGTHFDLKVFFFCSPRLPDLVPALLPVGL